MAPVESDTGPTWKVLRNNNNLGEKKATAAVPIIFAKDFDGGWEFCLCFLSHHSKIKKDGRAKHIPNKGAFNNYVDQILTIFDPLPPLSGQAWTFNIHPPVHVDKILPPSPKISTYNSF